MIVMLRIRVMIMRKERGANMRVNIDFFNFPISNSWQSSADYDIDDGNIGELLSKIDPQMTEPRF